jgi:hypothetical protein
MVGHLAPSMTSPVESFADLSKDFQPQQSILIIDIDIFTPVATRSNMIDAAGEF